jgi:hypothetical protein
MDYFNIEDELERAQRAFFDKETSKRKVSWLMALCNISQEEAARILETHEFGQAIISVLGQ